MSEPNHPEPPLTAEQVAALPDGTRIRVIWSGGNGPHTYATAHDRGVQVAATPWEVEHGRFDVEGKQLRFVGPERFHTRVWPA